MRWIIATFATLVLGAGGYLVTATLDTQRRADVLQSDMSRIMRAFERHDDRGAHEGAAADLSRLSSESETSMREIDKLQERVLPLESVSHMHGRR
ncbi:MAG: hypothetical protein GY944_24480 [bacterium]|nr:hypothetical protein [bacterium]